MRYPAHSKETRLSFSPKCAQKNCAVLGGFTLYPAVRLGSKTWPFFADFEGLNAIKAAESMGHRVCPSTHDPKVVSSLRSAQGRQICRPHQMEKLRAGTQDSGAFCFWGWAIKTNRSTPRPTYQTAERGALGCEDAEHCPEYSSIRNKKKPVTESPAQEGSLFIISCGEGTERPGGQVLRTSDCLAPAWG